MPDPVKPPKEDTRLRRAGRWGAYGAGAGGALFGGLAALHTRSVPWSLLSGVEGGLKAGIPSAAVGAITYRKPKPDKELSSILDNLIEFERGKQLLKQWSKHGGFTMPRQMGEAMDAVLRKDYEKFATFSPTATPEEVHAAMKFTRDKIATDQWKWRGVRRKVSNLENMVNKLKEEHGLSSMLDNLIQFKEKPKKEEKKPPTLNVIKARRSLMGTGGVIGAYAGGLISAEHGGGASIIGGASESMGKFTKYAKQDQARAARKDVERYVTIEDRFGGEQKLLRGGEKAASGGGAFKAGVRSAATRVGKFAKELPRRSMYAAQDVGYGVGKWLTRASLSRGIATGATIGVLGGRYLGTKLGHQMDRASAARSKSMRQARIRRQATDIAKAHVMAKAIAEGITSKQQMSAILDDLINFESITYHETEAERHQRKAGVHRDKAGMAATLGGYATSAGIAASTIPIIRRKGEGFVRDAGQSLIEKSRGFKTLGAGMILRDHPAGIWRGAVFTPAAVLAAGYAAHKIGSWRQTKKANVEYGKANESRLKRNALAQSKTKLSVKLDDLIQFDSRPRDPMGQFESQGEGGPNPNAMATVYKQPQQQPGITTGKGAGLALAGGALGGIGAAGGKDAYEQLKKLVNKLSAHKPPTS